MAYNAGNKLKHFQHVVEVYNSIKQEDIPDTKIVRVEMPKRGIFISYRKWMYIKGMKPSEMDNSSQLSLFES